MGSTLARRMANGTDCTSDKMARLWPCTQLMPKLTLRPHESEGSNYKLALQDPPTGATHTHTHTHTHTAALHTLRGAVVLKTARRIPFASFALTIMLHQDPIAHYSRLVMIRLVGHSSFSPTIPGPYSQLGLTLNLDFGLQDFP